MLAALCCSIYSFSVSYYVNFFTPPFAQNFVSISYFDTMFILLLILLSFFKTSFSLIGFTRSSLYEENETTFIAWKNEEIPLNLRQFFAFNDTTLLVTPPNGLSIDFVIARPLKINDTFISEWCPPSPEEYAKCDNDIMFVCNTPYETKRIFYNHKICNMELTCAALLRRHFKTYFITFMGSYSDGDTPKPDNCYRIIVTWWRPIWFHASENFINNKWIPDRHNRGGAGGLKYLPLPGHPKYHQSGRMLNAMFCGKPSFFPDSGLVFQKGIRKNDNIYKVIQTPLTTEIPFDKSETTAELYVSTASKPTQSLLNYLIPIIFGGICGGFICFALVCLIGFLFIRQKRKETFNGRPSFSLESFNESTKMNQTEAEILLSSKQNLSNVDSFQNNCGYSKLIQSEFENDEKVLSFQSSFENRKQSINQFLTQEFQSSNPLKGPKSVDKLLQEAFEEPWVENRAIKLLQIVIKVNNELYSLGYRNKVIHSSKFHLSTPSVSEQWLNSLKEGGFLRFLISVCEKEIAGKNGEFEENPKYWKMFLEKIDIFECFRHACFFGQSLQRRQFFIMATFYKMALLVAENPDRNSLLSMNFPIPLFVNLCEKYPHYFEIH